MGGLNGRRRARLLFGLLLATSLAVCLDGGADGAGGAGGARQTGTPAFTVERSTAEEVVLRFRLPAPPTVQLASEDGATVTQVAAFGGQSPRDAGAPDLPLWQVNLGVPPEGAILVQAETEEEERVALAYPVRRVRADPLLPAPAPAGARSPGAARGASAALASLGGVGEFRGLRVAAVLVRPVRLDESGTGLLVDRSVRVTVRFAGGGLAPRAGRDRREGASAASVAPDLAASAAAGEDPLLRDLVANWDTARRWRRLEGGAARAARAPVRAPQQSTDYFDGSRNWCRIEVTQTGLYALTYAGLLAAGIDPPGAILTGTLRLFHGDGLALPESLGLRPERWSGGTPPWMTECAIEVRSGSAHFAAGDSIVFYALGPQGWEAEYDPARGWGTYFEHPYSPVDVYWLTWQEEVDPPAGFSAEPVRMGHRAAPDTVGHPAYRPPHFEEHRHTERNLIENFRSPAADGWYWTSFSSLGRIKAFPVGHPDAVVTEPVRVRVSLVGHAEPLDVTEEYHYATVALNDPLFQDRRVGAREWTDEFEALIDSTGSWLSAGSESSMVWIAVADSCRRDSCGPGSPLTDYYDRSVYLNWIELTYRRQFRARGNQLVFTAPADTSGPVEYVIAGFSDTTGMRVLDITDPSRPQELATRAVSGAAGNWTLTVRDTLGSDGLLRRYLARAGAAGMLTPASARLYELPSGLEGEALLRRRGGAVDYLIVTYSGFEEAARRLAELREAQGQRVQVVTTESVMDEFGWGLMDPTALRDFILYAYRNWRENPGTPDLDAVLLLGDASKDFLGRNGEADDRNYVPSYEGRYKGPNFHGTYETDCATDDWFAYTDTSDAVPDFAVGRLPVRTAEDARFLAELVERYETHPEWGEWRQRIILAADDELRPSGAVEPWHTWDTEDLARNWIPPYVDIQKIYMTEYPLRGGVKPDAQQALKDAIDDGALFLNYIGHGDETRLADERLLEWDGTWEPANVDRRPIMVILSCSVGKFDMARSALAEILLLQRSGGISAAFSSSFLAFMDVNRALAQRFYQRLFDTRPLGLPVRRLGEAALLAKADVFLALGGRPQEQFDLERYAVLGDPALQPGWPRYDVRFEPATSDSLIRRGKSFLAASVYSGPTPADSLLGDFDGEAVALVRASADTSGYDYDGGHIRYRLAGPPIFWGQLAVDAGRLGFEPAAGARAPDRAPATPGEGEFYVAADAPAGNLGRIGVYVYDEARGADATGAVPEIAVSQELAFGDSLESDTQGPSITLLGPTGEPVASGALLPVGSAFTAVFADSHGINATGADPFYTLGYQLDGGEWVDLTRDFRVDHGGYSTGRVAFSLGGAAGAGPHTMGLRAADNLNNRSRVELEIMLTTADSPSLERVFSYPNPFRETTVLLYELTRPARVTARIYTAAGRLIRLLEEDGVPGQNSTLLWDGRDEAGDPVANGVYYVKLEARDAEAGGAPLTAVVRLARIR